MNSLLDRTCFTLLSVGVENPRCIGPLCTEWEDCCIYLLESETVLQEWIENPDKMTKIVVKLCRIGNSLGRR